GSGQWLLEDVAIEKEKSRQRLVLSRCAHACPDREIRKERVDLRLTHRLRMPLSVKEHKTPRPRDVRLLGPQAVVAGSDGEAHAIEKAGLPGSRIDDGRSDRGRRIRFHCIQLS